MWYKPNALSLRLIDPHTSEFCWEDWEEEMKKQHPFRFFFQETVPRFLRRNVYGTYSRPGRVYNWLYFHLLPSKRYHYLDLRPGTKSLEDYNYGYLSLKESLLFANFNLLMREVASGSYSDPRLHFSLEEIEQEPSLQQQLLIFEESKRISHYWTLTRPSLMAELFLSDSKLYWKKYSNIQELDHSHLMNLIHLRKMIIDHEYGMVN